MTENHREEIQNRTDRIETLQGMLEAGDVPDENVASAYNMQGKHARRVGDHHARLGEPRPAREWFGESVDFHCDAIREKRSGAGSSAGADEPYLLIDLVYQSLLSGDDARIDRAVRLVRGAPASFPEEHTETAPLYHYVQALAACLDGDDESLETHLAGFEDARQAAGSGFDRFYDGIESVLAGLNAADADRFETGLETVIADLAATEDDLLYARLAGSSLLALARRRGLDADVDSEHVYDSL